MFVRRDVREVPADEIVVEDRAMAPNPWSPAQIVAVLVGVGFVILGIAALARTGLQVDDIMSPQREVLSLNHTPLLGVIEIAFGALLILSGVVPGAARSMMAFLGVISAIFGLLLLVNVAPNRFHHWLGVGDPYGWMALIVGIVLLVAAFASPDFARGRSSRAVSRRVVR